MLYQGHTPTQRTGFTLVELLIVVVVIAVLVAITVVAYRGVASNAQSAALKSNLSQAATKLETYKIDNGAYPPDQATVASLIKLDPSISLTYAVSNTSSTPAYCLIAAQGTQQLSVSSTATAPTASGCAINLATDPAGTVLIAGGWAARWFGTAPAAGASSLATGANDGPLSLTSTYPRQTWTTAPPGLAQSLDTGFQFGSGTARIAVVPGSVITISGYVRASRQVNVSADAYLYDSTGANVVPTGWTVNRINNNGSPSPGVTGGFVGTAPSVWTRISTTFIVPAGVAGISVVLDRNGQGANGAQSWQVGDTFDATALMITQGSTLYNYADGNSPGWSWTGTPNASTSFGPPL